MSPTRPRSPRTPGGADDDAVTTVQPFPKVPAAEPAPASQAGLDPFSSRDRDEATWGDEIDAWGATLGSVVPEMRATPAPLTAVEPSFPPLSEESFDEAPQPLPLLASPDAAPEVWRDPAAWLGWQADGWGTLTHSAAAAAPADAALAEILADERLEDREGARDAARGDAWDDARPSASEATGGERSPTKARALALSLTAYRLAERSGDRVAARRSLDEALAAHGDSPAALRARLLGSELAAERGEASAELGLAWLKRLGAAGAEDARYYRTLAGEWALALAAEGIPAEANGFIDPADAFSTGLARSLARVEWARLEGQPERAADELETGAGLPTGMLRASLETLGARFYEVAGKTRRAAEVRSRAAANAGGASRDLCWPGVLRDAARLDGTASLALLRPVLKTFEPTTLAAAVARWAASLFLQSSEGEKARAVLAKAAADGATSPTLARDRFDLSVGGSVAIMKNLALEAAAAWPAVAAWPLSLLLAATARFDRRLVDPRTAPSPGQMEEDVRTVQAWLDEAIARSPGEKVLALVAERAAEAPSDLETRLRLFRTWASLDPTRSAPAWAAASSLSREARRPDEVTSSLRPLVEHDPGHPGFWWLAEQEAAAGRHDEAAARFEAGAAAWSASALSPWLLERAAEWRALRTPTAALETLARVAGEARGVEARGVRVTWLRVLRAAPDAVVAASLSGGDLEKSADGDEQASMWARVAVATGSAHTLEAALAARVADPQALALLMTGDRDLPERIADEIAAAARAVDGEPAVVLGLLGATWRTMAGEEDRARDEICALMAKVGARPSLAGFLRRAARGVSTPEVRARLLYSSCGAKDDPQSVEGDDAVSALELAEAMVPLREPAAERLLRRLAFGTVGPEARLAFLRLTGNLADLGHLWVVPPLEGFPGRLARLAEKAPALSAEECVRLVWQEPPHETAPSIRTQAWACSGLPPEVAPAILQACLADADVAKRLALPLRWRALAEARDLSTRAELLSRFAEALADRPRSAAALWTEAGGLWERVGKGEAARRAFVEAHRLDSRSFPALTGMRRLAVSAGELTLAAELAEQEDMLLAATRARVKVLLASARLAATADREEAALTLLQRAFSLAPDDAEVFTRLGDRLQASGRSRELADLLGERLMVTTNPFEMTSLKLRRAELLAGPLGERAQAKQELTGVLQKEPDHARALVDLAGLCEQDGAYGEAADLLVRRTLNERDGERLAGLYLRLGTIYRSHLHDDRRALGAFLKVLQIEPRHQESLAAALELHAKLGDARGAVPFAERLLMLSLAPEEERHFRIRLGQMQEQSQDLRQAAINLRRAWDQPPADLTALRELARFLERTRDERGRRVLLEDAQTRLLGEALDPEGEGSGSTAWRGLRDVATQRGLTLANRFAAQMAATLAPDASSASGTSEGHAPLDGRGLLARLLRDPEAEDRLYRALAPAVTSGLRALLRALAPSLSQDRKLDLRGRGLSKEERQGRGPLRELVTSFAHEAGVADVETFVKAVPSPTLVLPGAPSALVMGGPVAALGGPSLYFVAARSAYLLGAGTAFLLCDEPAESALFLAGLVRCFVPSFVHPSLPEAATEQRAQALARSIPKKRKAELAAFAWETAGAFDMDALREGAASVAAVVGLLGCGHLPSAVAALVVEQEVRGGSAAVRWVKEARTLASFALSSELDDLWRAWA